MTIDCTLEIILFVLFTCELYPSFLLSSRFSRCTLRSLSGVSRSRYPTNWILYLIYGLDRSCSSDYILGYHVFILVPFGYCLSRFRCVQVKITRPRDWTHKYIVTKFMKQNVIPLSDCQVENSDRNLHGYPSHFYLCVFVKIKTLARFLFDV